MKYPWFLCLSLCVELCAGGSSVFAQPPIDSDNDGVPDASDNAPLIPNADQTDTDGDGIGDVADPDIDGDGVLNVDDNAPNVPNPGQEDQDGDGLGDVVDTDDDGDGIPDVDDPDSPDFVGPDSDGDGVPDAFDNAPFIPNPDQADADGDGIGDVADNAPNDFNPGQEDNDGDGIGDAGDPDDDNDGIPDSNDPFPLDAALANDPIADAGGPYELLAGESLLLDGTGSFDPDEPFGDTLSFQWDVGLDGVVDLVGQTTEAPPSLFNSFGPEFDVSLTVTDSFGQSSTSSGSVTVTAPVPEPHSIALWSILGLGLAGFGYYRMRRKR